ncbi:uncharacterized protein LOC131876844 [Tigriopus californicus]|uniref:uncharacterized protein LOC131876844 n=1 Tax=Tigriopus californicus TaxID=6832 RepID=UPI0027DA80DA|nr:uncharacterized protein LOC131876844 [Tigriopus californicus]|eukprot:TCALIF_07002-PA protein Name:"Similar to Mb3657 Uncharacterized protein Mb3657 (Mycobacterium bovis (strain ATCC BAA-935 / AF2122/97))" AED:0.00 eAED:0.00 QI:184/1/1/1/1/1/7/185/326
MAPWHLPQQASFVRVSLILILIAGCQGETECNDPGEQFGHRITLETFLNIPKDKPAFSDDLVNMNDYQVPVGFDLEEAVYNLTDGPGYYVIKQAFSEEDLQLARDRVLFNTNPYKNRTNSLEPNEERHNNYKGMSWNLLNKGRIFSKIIQHPEILQLAKAILGENVHMSSLASNTVLPGMVGQRPHLDYPYYKPFFPTKNYQIPDRLGLQYVTMLTEFNSNNGGTAVRPHSHHIPTYPYDEDEFFANAMQAHGSPGDVIVFAGSIQHCAMPNKSKYARAAILAQMIPVYIKPFEDMRLEPSVLEEASPEMRKLLSLDHLYPMLKDV